MTPSSIITQFGEGMVGFVTSIGNGFVSLLQILLYGSYSVDSTTHVGSVTIGTTLGTVGTLAFVFVIIGLAWKIIPTVVGWLRLQAFKRRRAKAKK